MYIKATELKVEDNVYIIKVKVKDGTSPAPVIKQNKSDQTLELIANSDEVFFKYSNSD